MEMVQQITAFSQILKFEKELARYTGAPYAIMTDCCTHAIELCLRYNHITTCEFTAYTYISIPMTMHKLGISYKLMDEMWDGEYNFYGTNIWDSACMLAPNMYIPGVMQCLSFGHGKPLTIGGGGAILLENKVAYDQLIRMRYDGRDLTIAPWIKQKKFTVGYHYRPTIEQAIEASKKLKNYTEQHINYNYSDLRKITITRG